MVHSRSTAILQSEDSRLTTFRVAVLVSCFAILQTVPSLINGYPFIFFDTHGYYNAGKAVVYTLIGAPTGVEAVVTPADILSGSLQNGTGALDYEAAIPMSRSPYYGVFVFLFLNAEAFLLVLVQAITVAYAAWLVTKQICPQYPAKPYLIAGVICMLATPLPYFTAYAMPDVFAAMVPFCLFLLCFCRPNLSTVEAVFCWAVLLAAVAFHSSHVLLTVGLLSAFVILTIWPRLRFSLTGWFASLSALALGIAATFVFAFTSQAVFGMWPQSLPFLTARGIEDGPVAALVASDCEAYEFAICNVAPLNNHESQHFLWSSDGVYQTADAETKQRLSDEDFSVFLTAALKRPGMQLSASFGNFAQQQSQFGLYEFGTAKRVMAENAPRFMSPTNLQRFGQSLAVSGSFPFAALTAIIYVTVAFSLVIVIYVYVSRPVSDVALALGVVVLLTLVLNAAVCGILSDPHHRYQARLIWLLPFLACLLAFHQPKVRHPDHHN